MSQENQEDNMRKKEKFEDEGKILEGKEEGKYQEKLGKVEKKNIWTKMKLEKQKRINRRKWKKSLNIDEKVLMKGKLGRKILGKVGKIEKKNIWRKRSC